MRTVGIRTNLRDHAVLLLFVLFILVMVVVKPSFVTLSNANNVLIDVSIYGVAAVAMTISIITGAFDLSLSSNFAWGQILFCTLLNRWGSTPYGILAAFAVMLLCCTLLGCVNGALVVLGGIPPFIATLGMMTIIKGVSLLFTGGQMAATDNEFVKAVGKGGLLGISWLTYVFALVVIAAFFMMRYTRFGRALYATGGNPQTAQLAGIPVRWCRFTVFAILGFCAGLSAAMFVCLMRSGSVLYGTDLSLTCVAAAVIGGTPLTGGEGSVLKTSLGILLIFVVYKGLAFLGLQGYYNTMIRGVILLLVVAGNAYVVSRRRHPA